MKHIIVLTILFSICVSAVEPAKIDPEPLPVYIGNEYIPSRVIPYLGGRQSPGDSIGMTWYEKQANCSHGQRIIVDDNGNAHIDWMFMNDSTTLRYCAWNFRYADGSYLGQTPAAVSWSGFVQLAVTRDPDPDDQRTVIAYHYDAGSGYYSWIDIDQGQGWGMWPNDPKSPQALEHIWPYICVANNSNIIMATGDHSHEDTDTHHLYLTVDEGDSWIRIASFDSCSNLTQFVRASCNPGSNKVVFAHTQFSADTVASGQLDQDVWFMTSTDAGVTWGPHTNLTNYQPYPIDSVKAYADVNAVFDNNDNLHIVWTGRRVDSVGYWQASKIFHWDEINDTITTVSSPSIYYNDPGGWWITVADSGGNTGHWRLPADHPELIVAPNGFLYCLWHGNDDYTDFSADSVINGEFYGAYSSDNGITWADYVNLTNTRSPGAGPGECMDEDYMTANSFTVNDSIFITYIEDKDAGFWGCLEGVKTENPVRCWVFHKNLITGIKEETSDVVGNYDFGPTVFKGPLLLPVDKECRVFDITGRVVAPNRIRPGIYFIEIDGVVTRKVVKVR